MNIVATSGGFQSDGRWGLKVGPMLDFALGLTEERRTPRVCFMGTAIGDDMSYYARYYEAFNRDRSEVATSHLALFPMPNVDDVERHLMHQDLIWVGGGSVANLLAVWRAHGVDEILRNAWRNGVVLGGVSAGSLCWHVGGTTDSFGPDLRAVTNGIALLPYSNTPHYDSEARRRPLFQELIANGTLPPGWATDDGAGLHFRGTDFVEAVTDKPDAFAWHVDRDSAGNAVETREETRFLSS